MMALTDRPVNEPAETPERIDVDRLRELTALGDAKAFDPRLRVYDPTEHVPRGERRDHMAGAPGLDRPGLLGLRDKVRGDAEDRFEPPEAEQLAEATEPDENGDDGSRDELDEVDELGGESAESRDPEQLHAFGNKDAPRPPRLVKDLDVESWDSLIGPFAPTSPTDQVKGASTFIDPFHPEVNLSGKFHRLPPDYQPPKDSGLAIHADGKDVDRDAQHWWGHRTIYPTVEMTAAEFAQRVDELPWEYAGDKKKGK